MPCILEDVARRAGLSPSTVSRLLNSSGYVSAETQRRVDDAVAAPGCTPNRPARRLRGRWPHATGAIIPELSNTYTTGATRWVPPSRGRATANRSPARTRRTHGLIS
jgi:DNA-binding LacI/PurR family transcriptional regulator